MKHVFVTLFVFISMTNYCLAQWTEWYPVHTAIQVSFKYGKKSTDYSWIRFKNVSNQEFAEVRVEFDKFSNDKSQTTGLTAYNLKGNAIDESRGNWFHTDGGVRNIRITKLTDKNHKDLLKGSVQQNGVSEIYFPKKQQSPQEAKQQAEDEETETRLKVWQEQEKRKQEDLKRQNDAAARVREQRLREQEELAIQKNNQDEANKKRYKEQEEASKKNQKEISNSINEAGDIILKGINEAEEEREERIKEAEDRREKRIKAAEDRRKDNSTYSSEPRTFPQNRLTSEKYWSQGYNLYKQEKYREALLNYKLASAHYTTNIDFYYYVGLAEYKLQRYLEAIENFTTCINHDNTTFQSLYYRAQCYYQMNKINLACLDWNRSKKVSEVSEEKPIDGVNLDTKCFSNNEIKLNLEPSFNFGNKQVLYPTDLEKNMTKTNKLRRSASFDTKRGTIVLIDSILQRFRE